MSGHESLQDDISLEEINHDSYGALIQEFGAKFGLADHLTRVCDVDLIDQFSFGLTSYDERLKSTALPYLYKHLRYTLDTYDKIYHSDSPMASAVAAATNRQERRRAAGKQVRKITNNEMASVKTHSTWLADLSEHAREGITYGCSLAYLIQLTELNYYEDFDWEIARDVDASISGVNIASDELSLLFTDEEIDAGVTLGQLSLRLRERGVVDLSKKTLDSRFETILAASQVEIVRFLVRKTFEASFITGSTVPALNQRGQRLLQNQKAQFADADMLKMAGMVRDFQEMVERHIVGNKPINLQLRLISKAAHTVREQLSYLMHGFGKIYEHLGYELHPFLQKLEEEWAAEEQAQDQNTATGPKKNPRQSAQSDTEVTAEMLEWRAIREDILNDIQLTEQPYRYTSKRIRAFENGPSYVRDLAAELAAKGLLDDLATVQALAMLVFQSQQDAHNKNNYFEVLLYHQERLEGLMKDLGEAGGGKDHRSSLLQALNWLDEIAESDNDLLITDQRLQTLIYDYCVGPEVSTRPSLGKIAISEGPSDLGAEKTADFVEIPVSDRSKKEAKYVKLQADRRRAHELYGSMLGELLAQEDIEFVDIVAGNNGLRERSPYSATHQRHEKMNYTDIDVDRLIGLLELRDQLQKQGKTVELKFIRAAQNQAFPPFILYIKQPGISKSICVMENPVVGHASRIYSIGDELDTSWQEILQLPAKDRAELGVATLSKSHKPKGSPIFDQHYTLDLLSRVNLLLASQ